MIFGVGRRGRVAGYNPETGKRCSPVARQWPRPSALNRAIFSPSPGEQSHHTFRTRVTPPRAGSAKTTEHGPWLGGVSEEQFRPGTRGRKHAPPRPALPVRALAGVSASPPAVEL